MNGISRAYRPDLDALQARFALRVTAGLSEQSDALPHDIGERLRVAREQAVARARQTRRAQPAAAQQVVVQSQGRLALSPSPSGWQRPDRRARWSGPRADSATGLHC